MSQNLEECGIHLVMQVFKANQAARESKEVRKLLKKNQDKFTRYEPSSEWSAFSGIAGAAQM